MNKLRVVQAVLLASLLVLTGCKETEHLEEGSWEGIVTLGRESYFFMLEGEYQSWKISFPELMISDAPVTDLTFKNNTLNFSLWMVSGELKISMDREGNALYGKSMFSGIVGTAELHPGTFIRTYKLENRPFHEGTEVSVVGSRGLLYGTYLVPEGVAAYPCVLLISGSGPTDRDGNSEYVVPNNNVLFHLAQFLQTLGIASVRYDKYGVGSSYPKEGINNHFTFEDAVYDAAAWISFIEQQSEVTSYGIIGHSEGSLIGMLTSAQSSPDIFISIGGNGDSIDRQLVQQVSRINQDSAAVLERQLKLLHSDQPIHPTGDLITDTLLSLDSVPYIRSWMEYSPADELHKLDMNVLVLHGTHDKQVSEEDNRMLAEKTPQAKRFVIEGMNHMLRHAETDELAWASYRNADMPLHEQLEIILAEEFRNMWKEIKL